MFLPSNSVNGGNVDDSGPLWTGNPWSVWGVRVLLFASFTFLAHNVHNHLMRHAWYQQAWNSVSKSLNDMCCALNIMNGTFPDVAVDPSSVVETEARSPVRLSGVLRCQSGERGTTSKTMDSLPETVEPPARTYAGSRHMLEVPGVHPRPDHHLPLTVG